MNKYEPISGYEDIIDSRDIIARIDYLADPDFHEDGLTEENERELAALRRLAKQGESAHDWPYGAALIRESYFETYAQEFADDIGVRLPNSNEDWPFNHIDWAAAAAELAQDYTEVEFDDWEGYADSPITYLVR